MDHNSNSRLILAACAALVLVGACGNAESSKAGTFFSSPQRHGARSRQVVRHAGPGR